MPDLAIPRALPPIPFAPTQALPSADDTLIVSDLHLGLPDSRPLDLLDLLEERPFGRLILLGDVFHDPTLRHLDRHGWRLLRHLRRLSLEQHREVVWLHGNHDRKLSRSVGGLLGIEGREAYSWQQDGRRFVALHGDCFDAFLARHPWFGQLCSNAFAWQALARCYGPAGTALPPYLEARNYPLLRRLADRVEVHHQTMTTTLAVQAPASLDGFVLLDAQDWMTPAQLAALWQEIDRTASARARVICRSAGAASPVCRLLPEPLRQRWRRLDGLSDALFARDRSAVYGGFHVYGRTVH